MAPNTAHAAGHHQQPTRRQLSRIVPAIPHRLSRAAPAPRPVTPEESNKSTPKHEHERGSHEDAAEEQAVGGADHEASLRAEEAPLTPDSRVSVTEKDEAQTSGLGGSPMKPTFNPVQHGTDSLGWCAPDPIRTFDGASFDAAADYERTDHLNGPPVALPGLNGPSVDWLTNGVNRKLAVPAELPPPFYPANKMTNHILPAQENGYRHAPLVPPDTNAIVHATGEQNAAVNQNGSAHHPLPHPPPGFVPEFVPSQDHGQMLHHTEAGDSWPRIAQTLPISEPLQGPTVGPEAFRNGTSTTHINGYGLQNGSDSSHSHSPVKTQTFEQVRDGSDQGDDRQPVPYHQNRVSLQTNALMESPLELASYLSRQCGKVDFADYVLQVRFQSSILVSMPVHGIIVARSPVIAEAISRSSSDLHRSRDTRPLLEVTTTDTFISRESVEEAVRVLYGAPLLSAQTFLFGLANATKGSSQSPHDGAPQRMRELLNYIAAGRFFQIPMMQHCGVEIVRMLLRPDTVEQVLHFGLGSSANSRPSKNDLDFKDPFTTALLNYAIDFIACTFPRDFKLFSVAPELQEAPRLPPSLDVRPPTHHPRLSQIRFGDAPPEDDKQPSPTSRMLSSILLSLPLGLLDRLFNHPALAGQVGWSEVIRILREVIDERERRRKKWISGQVKPFQNCKSDSHLMNVLRTEERLETVEPTTLHPSGYRLLALWADERA